MKTRGVAAACAIVIACGGEVANRYTNAKVGQPCTPAVESSPAFLGFDPQEVSVELPSPDADPGQIVCIADHFRGRVTCPYGEDKTGTQLPSVDGATGGAFTNGAAACETPAGDAVTGDASDPTDGALVQPQCVDRQAARVVTWSCRCANAAGRTDDGATYCSCPDGTTCEQLVAPIGLVQGPDISGAYCIVSGTSYASFKSCLQSCDPNTTTCP
jgi:hypothetical protein